MIKYNLKLTKIIYTLMMDKPKLEKRENNIYKNDEQDQKQKNLGQTTEVNPDPNKRPESRPESKMMNFFNQEFIERKIDFKPKYYYLI